MVSSTPSTFACMAKDGTRAGRADWAGRAGPASCGCGSPHRGGSRRCPCPTTSARCRGRPRASSDWSSRGRAGGGRTGAGGDCPVAGSRGPRGAAEDALPVVGRMPVAALAPDVPRAWGCRASARLEEPGCSSLVWLSTGSRISLMPRWTSASRRSKSPMVPKVDRILR